MTYRVPYVNVRLVWYIRHCRVQVQDVAWRALLVQVHVDPLHQSGFARSRHACVAVWHEWLCGSRLQLCGRAGVCTRSQASLGVADGGTETGGGTLVLQGSAGGAGDTAGPGAARWDWPTYDQDHERLLTGAVSSLSAAGACLGGSGPTRVILVVVICHDHAEQRADAQIVVQLRDKTGQTKKPHGSWQQTGRHTSICQLRQASQPMTHRALLLVCFASPTEAYSPRSATSDLFCFLRLTSGPSGPAAEWQ